ncbi:polysaccharide biosynthesis/export family protein [Telmatobacter bradus]|uniref:polysaccharide biosynthesis/export family protein n=1 Tax=Telmatobacter bradus TaxID=474953 RepID=UPI003B4329F9
MHKTLLFSILLAMTLDVLSVSLNAQDKKLDESASPVISELQVGPGDMLDVSVWDCPDLSGRFRVNATGEISTPLLGKISVAGLSVEDVQRLIERSFIQADILKPASAHVTVFIAEYATQGITVVGEVRAPGVYPSLGVRMLLDVITAAGGETENAGGQVVIKRKADPEHPVSVAYNPTAPMPIISKVQLFPGDTVFIPSGGVVYALGNVTRQGVFPMHKNEPLTAERLLAMAGGSGTSPKMSRAQIVRTYSDGHKELILLNMHEIIKGAATDVALQNEDILYIPTNRGKLISLRAIEAMLGLGTNYMTYHYAQR